MGIDWIAVWQALVSGAVTVIIIQTAFERLAGRMQITDARTMTVITMFASAWSCTAMHVHFLGSRPLPNLITPAALLMAVLICMLFVAFLPSIASRHRDAEATEVEGSGVVNYVVPYAGWAMRNGLVALQVVLLRSGAAG